MINNTSVWFLSFSKHFETVNKWLYGKQWYRKSLHWLLVVLLWHFAVHLPFPSLCIYENIRCGRIWENNYKWQFVKYIAVATMINFLYDTLKFFSVVTIRARLFRRRIHKYTQALDTFLEFISSSRGMLFAPLDN